MANNDATVPSAARGAEGPVVGRTWARYRLVRPLGAGGMGTVWEAHDPELDRAVALKVLHDELLGRASQERLRDEARAMARIAHPNVVPVFDVGEHGGRSYYTMELVRGGSVRDWLAEPRPWRDVRRVFADAARGLAAIHAAGIVHRDIKPGNLMVGDDGRARVTDLGLAGPTADDLVHAGTPAYMAPEQLRGAIGDARSDQFAFGVALWEALYGAHPFAAPGLDARLAEIAAGPGHVDTGGATQDVTEVSGIAGDDTLDAVADAESRSRGGTTRPRRRTPDGAAKLRAHAKPRPRRTPGAGGIARPRTMTAMRRSSARVPRWLEDVARRAMAAEPASRFGDIAELARALEPPARRRWPWIAVGVASLAIAVVIVVATRGGGGAAEPTCDAERELAGVWDAPARARLAVAFSTHASLWLEVERTVERHAQDWRSAADAACRARLAGESEQAVEPRAACLAQRIAELREVVRTLGALDEAGRRTAPAVARSLSPVADCGDPAYLASVAAARDPAREAVRDQLAAARIGRPDLAVAQRVLVEARKTGDAQLEGAALLAVGRAQADRDQLVPAAATLADAIAAGDGKVRLEAQARASVVLQRLGRLEEAGALLDAAEAALATTPDKLREAAVASARGTLFGRRRQYLAALERFTRAIALYDEIYGSDSTAQAPDVRNIAIVLRHLGRSGDALAALQGVYERDLAAYGPNDAEVARDLVQLGAVHTLMGSTGDAVSAFERARKILPTGTLDRASVEFELAVVRWRLEQPDEAIARMRESIAIRRELTPDAKETLDARSGLATMLVTTGRTAEAELELRAVIAGRTRLFGAASPAVAMDEIALGDALGRLGRHDEALATLERARASLVTAFGSTDGAIAAALAAIARVERARGRHRAALELDERASAMRVAVTASPAEHAASALALAKDHLAVGDFARARASAEAAHAHFAKAGPSPQLADAKWTLARAAWEAGARDASTLALARAARDLAARLTTVAATVPLADLDAWLATRVATKREN